MTGLPTSPLGDLPTAASLLGNARAQLARCFGRAGIETADLDARLLLCAACGIDHLALIRDHDRPLGEAATVLAAFAVRRLAYEPVSRILGRREFWGMDFAISPDVLDPRADTEALIGAVLDALGARRQAPLRLLDLGAGSGAILAALLHELPGASGIGIDRSPVACRLAAGNLQALGFGARAAVVCGSWTDPLAGVFDVIVSNPPYIPSRTIGGLDAAVRDHDPPEALDGGLDGLEAYRAFLPNLSAHLAPGGIVAVECGWDQGETVATLFRETGFTGVLVHRDLGGHPRVVIGSAPFSLGG